MLDLPRSDGSTLRDHLLAYEASTGVTPAELIPPEGAECCDYLLEIFWSVNTLSADSKITSASLLDWCRLHRLELASWEITIIERLDDIFQRCLAEHHRREMKKSHR